MGLIKNIGTNKFILPPPQKLIVVAKVVKYTIFMPSLIAVRQFLVTECCCAPGFSIQFDREKSKEKAQEKENALSRDSAGSLIDSIINASIFMILGRKTKRVITSFSLFHSSGIKHANRTQNTFFSNHQIKKLSKWLPSSSSKRQSWK